MAPFPLVTQRNIAIACFVLHNLIRKEDLSDELFTEYDQPNVSLHNKQVHVDADEDEVEAHCTASDREYMTQLRDEIAEQLMQIMNSMIKKNVNVFFMNIISVLDNYYSSLNVEKLI
ncbi:hypothetical protein HanIR_Chr04g0166941 [Helianthus annuus]|nr:hypothetical protein HanIR_Chr04g0166941 [Helianthus annuus]